MLCVYLKSNAFTEIDVMGYWDFATFLCKMPGFQTEICYHYGWVYYHKLKIESHIPGWQCNKNILHCTSQLPSQIDAGKPTITAFCHFNCSHGTWPCQTSIYSQRTSDICWNSSTGMSHCAKKIDKITMNISIRIFILAQYNLWMP